MASGRTSCTVGSYQTAEVYSNTSGGASSVTLNATSTDSTKCFKISVNISDTSITPQTLQTVLCSCASLCGCLDYSQVVSYGTDTDGTFKGVTCYQPDVDVLQGYQGQFTYTRCTGDRVSKIAGLPKCPQVEMGMPMPWIGSLSTYCTTDFVWMPNTCWTAGFRLQNFVPHGGTVEPERVCEWIAAGNCIQAAYCSCGCTDRDGCAGSSSCYSYRPNYGVYGSTSNTIVSNCCSMWTQVSMDYWATFKHMVTVGPSQSCSNCMSTRYACPRCHEATVATLTQSNNCQDNMGGNHCFNHCFDFHHRCGNGNFSNAIGCLCSCHGNLHRAWQQSWYKAMCNVVWMFPLNLNPGFGELRAKPSNVTNPCMLYCHCNEGGQSMAKFCLCIDGTMPIKWATYNCIDGKNYFMWQHHNAPNWNGIYSIDEDQYTSIIDHTCCCQCTCINYNSGDEFPTTFATKVADLPQDWASANAKDTYFVNAHQVGPTCFVTLFGVFDNLCECFNMDRYYSSDLKTWDKTASDEVAISTSESVALTGTTTCLDVVSSNYGTLCTSGQIEHNTQGIQLERTGLVTSNGDKIYVKNIGDSAASISVWGYEE
jgi:hypothetical protein